MLKTERTGTMRWIKLLIIVSVAVWLMLVIGTLYVAAHLIGKYR